MKRKKRIRLFLVAGVLAGLAFGAYYWMRTGLEPMPSGKSVYVRFEDQTRIGSALRRLTREGIIRDSRVLRVYAWLNRYESAVPTGTYLLRPGMTADEVLRTLQRPIRQMVRIPETNWARRTANVLEQKGVTTAEEYLKMVNSPGRFEDQVGFPLPENSLEGYLYPDTYDLPPLLGAKAVIDRQLRTFEKKVYEELEKPEDLHRLITIASLVELEVKFDNERPIVAGVIENRLKRGMLLQIDAAINYGIQKWRPLTYADYRNVDSPYNLYRNKGLPPGPICSPTVKSVQAAMNPAKHEFLYYVAMPDGRSIFAKTYDEHLKNVAKRRKALREAQ